jgi:epoxyqueuosine reductase
MMNRLIERLRGRVGEEFQARALVDTGPALERALAAAAGLGWIGKNTCLLNGEWGSYLFLGEIVTTLELEADEPVLARCAMCTRCLDACPTGALVEPHVLDARRCISYLTTEQRGALSEALQGAMGQWVYGCDVCQQVCPYNARAPQGTQEALMEDRTPASIDLEYLLDLGSGEYRRFTRDAATRRARRPMWRRNAAVALGNSPGRPNSAVAALEDRIDDEDPVIRETALASLRRLRGGDGTTREPGGGVRHI